MNLIKELYKAMPIQNGTKKIFLWGIPIVAILIISILLFLHSENKKKIEEVEQEAVEAKQLKNYYGTLSSIYQHICWSEQFSLECATNISRVWEDCINKGVEFGGVEGAGVLSELGVQTVLDELEKQGLKEKAEKSYAEVQAKMASLNQCPARYQEAYNQLLELYSIYCQIYNLAFHPSGSLISFNNKIEELKSQFAKQSEKLKVLLFYSPTEKEGEPYGVAQKSSTSKPNLMGMTSKKNQPPIVKAKRGPFIAWLWAAPHNDKGRKYLKQENYSQAAFEFTKAIAISPKSPRLYLNRGLAYRLQKEYELAISDFTKVIELEPSYTMAYCYRGMTFMAAEDYVKAISDFSKEIELDPTSGKVYLYRGMAYGSIQDFTNSLKDLTKAQSLGEEVDSKLMGLVKAGEIFVTPSTGAKDKTIQITSNPLPGKPERILEAVLEGIVVGAKGEYKALINGNLYSEGGNINGARIEKVKSDSIEIIFEGEKREVKIGDAF